MPIDLRPTRRGAVVALLALAAAVTAATAGVRALPAIVVPAVVVLLAGAAHLAVVPPPTVERLAPPPGHVGDDAEVRLHVEVPGTVAVHLRAPPSSGLGTGPMPVVNGPGRTTISHRLERRERGVHALGPMAVALRDPLGLLERRVPWDAVAMEPGGADVTVYPPRRRPPIDLDGVVAAGRPGPTGPGRGAFDRLDAYRPGDPLRDVHWASSAKRADDRLLVRRYAADEWDPTVAVGVDGPPARADDLAATAAGIVAGLEDRDVPVVLYLADDGGGDGGRKGGRGPDGLGDAPRDPDVTDSAAGWAGSPMARLARTGAGRLDPATRRSVDVLVTVPGDGGPVAVETGEDVDGSVASPDGSAPRLDVASAGSGPSRPGEGGDGR